MSSDKTGGPAFPMAVTLGRPRENFIGMKRPCAECGELITVTPKMIPHGKYLCRQCQSKGAMAWARAHPEQKRLTNQRYFDASGDAATIVRRAIERGELNRKPCELCGDKAHAHHDNYNKPLVVRWLCPTHHTAYHRSALVEKQRREPETAPEAPPSPPGAP